MFPHREVSSTWKHANSYSQAIEANSVDATAFLGRAQCFLKLGLFSAALVDAEVAMKLDLSLKKQALAVKARALHKSNQPQLALETYNQVLDPGTEVNWSSSRIKEEDLRECRRERSKLVCHLAEGGHHVQSRARSSAPGLRAETLFPKEEDGTSSLNSWIADMFQKQTVISEVLRSSSRLDVREALEGPTSQLLAGATRLTPWQMSEEEKCLRKAESAATRQATDVYNPTNAHSRCASRSRHASKYASLTGSNAAPALASCAAPITAPRHIVRPSTAKLPHKGAAPQGGGSVRPASARHAARRNNPGNTPAVEACSPSGGGGWSRRQALRFEDEAWSIPFDQLLSSTDAYVDDGSARVSAYPEMPSTSSKESEKAKHKPRPPTMARKVGYMSSGRRQQARPQSAQEPTVRHRNTKRLNTKHRQLGPSASLRGSSSAPQPQCASSMHCFTGKQANIMHS
mmetsp:Transcript_25858/g.49134  ORF Transcript_25858/g.49134 Transcript_25858/m.49134 type:complete len:459 (+) Transcript_25858:664-2040(+)